VCTLAATYGDALSAARAVTDGLGEDERTRVFEATATRVYDL
jgi:L-fuconolactonase